jgi:CHAT domain-containing protein
MAAEVMLANVATVVLEQGVKFLYDQAGKVLDAWRAGRRDPAAPPPVLIPTPADVTVGPTQPGSATPDADAILTLEDLRTDAERITSGHLDVGEPAARATIAALRDVVEAALGTSITFAGEATRPVRVSDVNIVVNDVRGRLAGVRLAAGQGADVTQVRIQAHDVEAGGDVVGVEIGGGGEGTDQDESPRPEQPIRILFLAANPVDGEPLKLDEEVRAIDGALREAQYRDRFEIEQQWAVRADDLQRALLRWRPDIVHFSGHGAASSELVLADESGGGRVVPGNDLARLFSLLSDDIRCVVLNACYSDTQAKAIAESIDCVVGMTNAVGDDAAILFATGFYRGLGYGRDVRTAFELGTNLIGLQGVPDVDVPHLVARNVKAEDVFFVRTG